MENRNRLVAVIKLSVLLLFIVGLPVLLYINCRDTIFNKAWLAHLPQFLAQYKGQAAVILLGLQILQVIICIVPSQPIQFASSYLFGVFRGYLISIAGAFIGAFIVY